MAHEWKLPFKKRPRVSVSLKQKCALKGATAKGYPCKSCFEVCKLTTNNQAQNPAGIMEPQELFHSPLQGFEGDSLWKKELQQRAISF